MIVLLPGGNRMPRLTVRIARRGLAATLAGIALGGIAFAQAMPPAMPSPNPAAPASNAPLAPPGATAPVQRLGQARLEQLVAPVALYPDPLLAQILMASTYPLEVVEAARWVGVPANRRLADTALTTALGAENWDPSIKALVPFPRVLATMSNQLQWTGDLGNAFLAQQADVMAAVQSLRQEAMAAGNLGQTPQCHCVIRTSGPTISILPAAPQAVCVPYYSPAVYGPWPDPADPPVYFPIPAGFAYAPGFWIGFEPPIALAVFGPYWGWGWVDWGHRYIAVDPARYALVAGGAAAFAGGVWAHNPAHRGGVRYADPVTRARFDAARVSTLTAATRSGAATAPAIASHLGTPPNGAALGRSGGAAATHGGAAVHGAAGLHGTPSFRGGAGFRGASAHHGGPAAHAAEGSRGGPTALRGGPASHGGGPHGGGGTHAAGQHGGGGGGHHG
jgi:hypothetical protein